MLLGGLSLAMTSVSRNWIPEKKGADYQPLWRHKPLQLLMIEGCFIGFGWGLFDVAVPAFTTIEKVPHMTAWIFAAMGIANVIGGLLAGLVSKRTSSLKAMRRTYGVWFIVAIPMALSYPTWFGWRCNSSFLLGSNGGNPTTRFPNSDDGLALDGRRNFDVDWFHGWWIYFRALITNCCAQYYRYLYRYGIPNTCSRKISLAGSR
jgi:MFS family permease